MRPIVVAGAILAYGVAAAAAQDYSGFVASAKHALAKDFKDPEGANYRGLAVYRELGGKDLYLCGEVNAKNSFGAFIGYVPFFARPDNVAMKEGADDSLFEALKKAACAKRLAAAK